MVNFSIVVKSK